MEKMPKKIKLVEAVVEKASNNPGKWATVRSYDAHIDGNTATLTHYGTNIALVVLDTKTYIPQYGYSVSDLDAAYTFATELNATNPPLRRVDLQRED